MTDKFYKELYEVLYKDHGYHSSEDHWNGTHYPTLFSACLDPSGIEYNTVLDVGCSTGLGIKHFFEPRGKTCWGIDVSETAINKAIARGCNAKQASITNIPFKDHSFDLVCSTDVIEHLKPEDQEVAWRECFRVSKSYVAHKIANTPEGKKFGGHTLHLTCPTTTEYWYDFFDSLSLPNWKLIFKMTPEVWKEHEDKIHTENSYEKWVYNGTVVVFEKQD